VPDQWERKTPELQEFLKECLAYAGKRSFAWDELGPKLPSMLNPQSNMYHMMEVFLKWESGRGSDSHSSIANGTSAVDEVYLSVIGCGTIENFRGIKREYWHNGLGARITPLTPPKTPYKRHPLVRGNIEVPDDVLIPLRRFHARLGIPQLDVIKYESEEHSFSEWRPEWIEPYPEPKEVTISDDAAHYVEEYMHFLMECADGQNPDGSEIVPVEIKGNYKRHKDKAIRIAALLAMLGNGGKIEMPQWTAAWWIAEQMRESVHEFYSQCFSGESTPQHKLEERVLAYIRAASNEGEWTSIKVLKNRTRIDVKTAEEICESYVRNGIFERIDPESAKKPAKYALFGTPIPVGKRKVANLTVEAAE
jgi:hypothetical protein